MKKTFAYVSGLLSTLAIPLVTFAAPLNNVNDVALRATEIGNLVIRLAIALAIVWLVVSIVRFFIAGGEEGRTKGKQDIIYGVIGLFVIFSIWGLVFILTQSFSTTNRTPIEEINRVGTLPPLPPTGGGSGNGLYSSGTYDIPAGYGNQYQGNI